MRVITKLFSIVCFSDYYYTKVDIHKNIWGEISFLRILLMGIIVKEAICTSNLELHRDIPSDGSRYKRQLIQEESRPHGHASVNTIYLYPK